MNRRTFLKGALGAAVISGGACLYGLDTHNLELPIMRFHLGLSRTWHVAALGDLHFDPLYEEAYLSHVVRRLSALRPDLVLFTGDFITSRTERMHDLARLLGTIDSRFGSFAVLGNHDMWYGADIVTRQLSGNGIRVLRNSCCPLPGEEKVFLTGLESFWSGRPQPSIIGRTPADSRHILLVHEPDSFVTLDDPRIRLQISGHTHGGQVRVPLKGAVIHPKFGKLFDAGLFTRQNRCLYVNRGVGTLRPHVRVNCRPEVTVFELS